MTIYHQFHINASLNQVFPLFSTLWGLEKWWSKGATGKLKDGGEIQLYFGEGFHWTFRVRLQEYSHRVEYLAVNTDADWNGTKICISVHSAQKDSTIDFRHEGWQEPNEHFRISSFCWAKYLDVAKHYAELGIEVPYEKRLD